MRFFIWIIKNKEWVFSGLGIFVISSILALSLKNSPSTEEAVPLQSEVKEKTSSNSGSDTASANNHSTIVQVDGPTGNIHIGQSPTVQEPSASVTENINFKKSDFQRIRIIEGQDNGWEDLSNELDKHQRCTAFSSEELFNILDGTLENQFSCDYGHLYLDREFTEKADYLVRGFGAENPSFEIIFVNNYSIDLTITQIGVEILDTKWVPWTGGNPMPETVPVVAKYSIDIPDDLCAVHPNANDERVECALPRLIGIELEDPLFLTPTSVFRYNLQITDSGNNAKNTTLVRFYLHTNAGKAFSGLVFIRQ